MFAGVEFYRDKRLGKMPDHGCWMAFFRDPDGNLLAPILMQSAGGFHDLTGNPVRVFGHHKRNYARDVIGLPNST